MSYFCAELMETMTTTERIIQYATLQQGPFRKKDLASWLFGDSQESDTSLQKQLERLVASGRLTKMGWGSYRLNADAKPRYFLTLKPETREMGAYLRTRYPLADFCIWDASSVIPFMLHMPNIRMTIVDVERMLEPAFPDALREKYPGTLILPNPTQEEFFKFGSTSDCIVLHTLTTESPLDSFEGLPVPQVEKMLVDIVLNPEFDFLRGSELSHVYREAFSGYDISRSRLLRYARRRGCENRIHKLIDRINELYYD